MNDHFHQLERPKVSVTVRLGDEIAARSERAMLLKECAHGRILDPVYYFPPDDVAVEKLRPSESQTHCPIKGDASYLTFLGDAGAEVDLVWVYTEPVEYSKDITGRMAFDARRVSIEVEPLDGNSAT